VSEFTPSRLTLARKRRGITKKELAAKADVSARSLFSYERGDAQPTPETVARLASALDFPGGFFSAPDQEEPSLDGTSFRALSRLPAGKRDQALGAAALALALDDWIQERFVLPEPSVPQLRGVDPETAAEVIRTEWNMGQRAIPNMVQLLEAHGIRVFSLAEEYAEVDAFSFWRNNAPFVFLNMKKSAERSRMDAAHELGHLVLHWRHESPRGREYEHEAEIFASAFLMPRGSVLAEAPRGANLDGIIAAKRRWKVSAAALTYRMHAVGLLSDWQYRAVFVDISRRGFRKAEPNEIPRESSQVLAKVFAALREEGMTKADVASVLSIPVAELEKLVFGLVIMPLQGGAQPAPPSAEPPRLRLV
jgi:Zn-dependent peptidase ImmA (M78 family)/DNA-binding XRE family transcriptional regulator